MELGNYEFEVESKIEFKNLRPLSASPVMKNFSFLPEDRALMMLKVERVNCIF